MMTEQTEHEKFRNFIERACRPEVETATATQSFIETGLFRRAHNLTGASWITISHTSAYHKGSPPFQPQGPTF